APGCNVELHDVVFAAGADPESLHERLLDLWFGSPEGLHVDAWTRVESVPGYRVRLVREPPGEPGPGLWFVNIGGYAPGELWERHAYALYGGADRAEVKRRAKRELLKGKESVHRDDLVAVDDMIRVDPGDGWHVMLEADGSAGPPEVVNGYFPIPRRTVDRWKRRR
ncbi:MAG: DUF1543 domain-containing protein, partial [Wenzhouxiangellaceae bacterium]|nr:DUF1543 domain-containing protein [Wenzhouxiangellaceae bacterium]